MSKVMAVDCSTGEGVLRDMTQEEEAQRAIDIAEGQRRAQEQAEVKAAVAEREADLEAMLAEWRATK